MTGYTEVTVIVDGALEESENFGGGKAEAARFDAFLARVEAEAEADGLLTEVYTLDHPHAEDAEECACAQYATDHHPAWTFNAEAADFFDAANLFEEDEETD